MSEDAPHGYQHGNDGPGTDHGDSDEPYSSKDRVWSGEPNGGLVG